MVEYESWRAAWLRTAEAIRDHGGELQSFAISSPASEADVLGVEVRLGRQLPCEFRDTLLNFASSVHVRWRLAQMPEVGAPLRRLSHGEIHWDLAAILRHEGAREGWAEIYDAPDEALIWADKLAFQRAANGDLLAWREAR